MGKYNSVTKDFNLVKYTNLELKIEITDSYIRLSIKLKHKLFY